MVSYVVLWCAFIDDGKPWSVTRSDEIRLGWHRKRDIAIFTTSSIVCHWLTCRTWLFDEPLVRCTNFQCEPPRVYIENCKKRLPLWSQYEVCLIFFLGTLDFIWMLLLQSHVFWFLVLYLCSTLTYHMSNLALIWSFHPHFAEHVAPKWGVHSPIRHVLHTRHVEWRRIRGEFLRAKQCALDESVALRSVAF